MKTLVIIILSLLLFVEAMIPAMETLELAKLPALIEHYQKHKAESPELSLLAFFKLHYENPKHHDQDPQTHHSLPFGNHHQHNCAFVMLLLTIPDVSLTASNETVLVKNPVEYQTPSALLFYASIWQPPRLG